MTRDVQKARPEDTIQEAARVMTDIDAGALPVGTGDVIEGILTDRDIIIRAVAEGFDPTETTVREIMSSSVTTCRDDELAAEVAARMRARQIRRMPVQDAEGHLVGMVTLSDIARGGPAVARTPEEELREAAGDKPRRNAE